MVGPNPSRAAFWRHCPWLLGLLLAPLLFGSVNPDGQAVVGLLFAVALFLLAPDADGRSVPCLPAWLRWLAGISLVLPLIPWPAAVVSALSPRLAELAARFPLEPNTPVRWLALSASPADTAQRCWEIALMLAAFALARQGARERDFSRWFAGFLAVAVGLLVASDLWYRAHGRQSILGLWQVSWGYGAGTFANRNHFANWVAVAVLVMFGIAVRTFLARAGPPQVPVAPSPTRAPRLLDSPGGRAAAAHLPALRGAWPVDRPRAAAVAPPPPVETDRSLSSLAAIVTLGVALVGLAAAVASGSRGGLLGFLVGAVTWGALVAWKGRTRRHGMIVAGVLLLAVLAMVPASTLLLQRLADLRQGVASNAGKLEIWQGAWALFLQFPGVGIGWDAFATVFNHFKTFGGDRAFLFVENEYLQLLVEGGIAGALVWAAVAVAWGRGLWQLCAAREAKASVPVFGAVAGLAAFAAHGCFEFLTHVPANAVLAAALLGWLAGSRDLVLGGDGVRADLARRARVRALTQAGLALVLGGAAVLQGLAWWEWRRAVRTQDPTVARAQVRQSLRWWPLATGRAVGLIRAETRLLSDLSPAQQASEAARIRAEANRSLRLDPFDWELRLERAWLAIVYGGDPAAGVAEAFSVTRLNPRQPAIPLQFADYYKRRRPEVARALLRETDLSLPGSVNQALQLAWEIDRDPRVLWSVAPATPAGLFELGEFGLQQKLYGLAAQAYWMLTNRVAPLDLANRLLEAQRPDLALRLFPAAPATPDARLMVCVAHARLRDFQRVFELVEDYLRSSHWRQRVMVGPRPSATLEALKAAWKQAPEDAATAGALAEALFELPPERRDLALLREVVSRFPDEPRLLWVLMHSEREARRESEAAQTALRLMERFLRPR